LMRAFRVRVLYSKKAQFEIPPVPPGNICAAGSRIGVHFRDALGDQEPRCSQGQCRIHFLSLPKYKYHVALHILNDHTTSHFSGTRSFQYFLAGCETAGSRLPLLKIRLETNFASEQICRTRNRIDLAHFHNAYRVPPLSAASARNHLS
jgi:hypothetical protein